jgi:hypothetical protein
MVSNDPPLFAEDGLRGPVGETFGAALHQAGERLGFAVHYPQWNLHWVDQTWRGRQLLVRWSPVGVQAVHTGYRWIAVRLSTTRLGTWADPPEHDADQIEGVRLIITPRPPTASGVWAEDARLSADLWAFLTRLCPWGPADDIEQQRPWAQLHVRNDGVVWNLRAGLLTEALLTEAIELLARIAAWAETNDATLTARLGRASGTTSIRRIRRTITAVAIIVTTAAVLIGLRVIG